jgi:hypothetical protein
LEEAPFGAFFSPLPLQQNIAMRFNTAIQDQRLVDAWADVLANTDETEPFEPHSPRLAFNDPEFILRPEARGVRLQLELLKPDLAQQALGINHTVVVFGSARFRSQEDSAAALQAAQGSGDAQALARAQRLVRNAH